MNCPKCKGAGLNPQRLNMLLEVDTCPSCRGVWFDQQEIYAQVKSPTQFFEAFKEAYQDSVETKFVCPRDGQTMIQATIKAAELPFEACTKCGGMWFDQGEVEKLNAYLEKWDVSHSEGK